MPTFVPSVDLFHGFEDILIAWVNVPLLVGAGDLLLRALWRGAEG